MIEREYKIQETVVNISIHLLNVLMKLFLKLFSSGTWSKPSKLYVILNLSYPNNHQIIPKTEHH